MYVYLSSRKRRTYLCLTLPQNLSSKKLSYKDICFLQKKLRYNFKQFDSNLIKQQKLLYEKHILKEDLYRSVRTTLLKKRSNNSSSPMAYSFVGHGCFNSPLIENQKKSPLVFQTKGENHGIAKGPFFTKNKISSIHNNKEVSKTTENLHNVKKGAFSTKYLYNTQFYLQIWQKTHNYFGRFGSTVLPENSLFFSKYQQKKLNCWILNLSLAKGRLENPPFSNKRFHGSKTKFCTEGGVQSGLGEKSMAKGEVLGTAILQPPVEEPLVGEPLVGEPLIDELPVKEPQAVIGNSAKQDHNNTLIRKNKNVDLNRLCVYVQTIKSRKSVSKNGYLDFLVNNCKKQFFLDIYKGEDLYLGSPLFVNGKTLDFFCRYLYHGEHIKTCIKPQVLKNSSPVNRAKTLHEKKKISLFYGSLAKKEMSILCKKASLLPGLFEDNMYTLLESRVDVLVYRAGFSKTIANARQLVRRGLFFINGRKIYSCKILGKPGDVLHLGAKKKHTYLPLCYKQITKTLADLYLNKYLASTNSYKRKIFQAYNRQLPSNHIEIFLEKKLHFEIQRKTFGQLLTFDPPVREREVGEREVGEGEKNKVLGGLPQCVLMQNEIEGKRDEQTCRSPRPHALPSRGFLGKTSKLAQQLLYMLWLQNTQGEESKIKNESQILATEFTFSNTSPSLGKKTNVLPSTDKSMLHPKRAFTTQKPYKIFSSKKTGKDKKIIQNRIYFYCKNILFKQSCHILNPGFFLYQILCKKIHHGNLPPQFFAYMPTWPENTLLYSKHLVGSSFGEKNLCKDGRNISMVKPFWSTTGGAPKKRKETFYFPCYTKHMENWGYPCYAIKSKEQYTDSNSMGKNYSANFLPSSMPPYKPLIKSKEQSTVRVKQPFVDPFAQPEVQNLVDQNYLFKNFNNTFFSGGVYKVLFNLYCAKYLKYKTVVRRRLKQTTNKEKIFSVFMKNIQNANCVSIWGQKPLHLEISQKTTTFIYLYRPQKIVSPICIDFSRLKT